MKPENCKTSFGRGEQQRIHCGEAHLQSAHQVNYKGMTRISELL
jgi:hypothetical protein